MFDPVVGPRVYRVPIGADFSSNFVEGLLARTDGQPPEALARVEIFVNTRRMDRRLRELFRMRGALLLPKIHLMTDIAHHPKQPIAFPKPVSPLRRQLLLARLVGQLLDHEKSLAPQSAKFDLARSLAGVMDELQGEGIGFSALENISVHEQSAHWDRSLRFLRILTDVWEDGAAVDPQDRQRQAAEAFSQAWRADPPDHPVLAIGSTGSRGASAVFMRAVAALPQGAVVLPGVDTELSTHDWEKLATEKVSADHPQSAVSLFCESLGLNLFGVDDWTPDFGPFCAPRNALVSLSLRPAPYTDEWLEAGPKLAGTLEEACKDVSIIEAQTPREEANAIAARMRKAAQHGQTAALITPDGTLTRRVSAALGRWGIRPDDSAGRPLHLTPPAVFLRLVCNCIGRELTPLMLTALVKHPMIGRVHDGSSHLFIRELEKKVLRGGAPFVDFDAIDEWAIKKGGERQDWANWLRGCLQPLAAMREGSLETFLEAHIQTAETLARGYRGDAEMRIWLLDDGEETAKLFAKLNTEADAAPMLTAADFGALIDTSMRGEEARDPLAGHPKISILGTLEARVQSADLVILGGLNDSSWPGTQTPDPWLNRAMRKQAGLPPPERKTGLSAHDYQQAMAAKKIVLSRAVRDGEAPTVASRWVVRFLNLLKGLGREGELVIAEMETRGKVWVDLARALDRPLNDVAPSPRPSPCPPVDKRLKKLSVTQIQTLARDPFAIYARAILGLYKLDPLGKEADALERGNVAHKVLEEFVFETTQNPALLNETHFNATVARVLEERAPWPAVRRIWAARLRRISSWFVETERVRQGLAKMKVQEVRGHRDIAALGFQLTAKVDRIDQSADGALRIYDYKSGKLKSRKEVDAFDKQLPLEAAIAVEGGFKGLEAADVSYLGYVGLSEPKKNGAGEEMDLDADAILIQETWQYLEALIGEYSAAAMGFTARSRPHRIQYESDYDHLSRRGEWEDGDDAVSMVVP